MLTALSPWVHTQMPEVRLPYTTPMDDTAGIWLMSAPATMGSDTTWPVSSDPVTYPAPWAVFTKNSSLADMDTMHPKPDEFSGTNTLAVVSKLAGMVGSPPFHVPHRAGVTSLKKLQVTFSPVKVMVLGPWSWGRICSSTTRPWWVHMLRMRRDPAAG